ncbi:MAG: MBL fold metallo-hydrolase [Deltaproteobacteria bacterium]|jgi:glyoxylase-like metal-dependent hydrolase (beta-lactamase superfamily II)|nr:MBL fold metallo-hydrolase [Deltaproteobacteria bacterium]
MLKTPSQAQFIPGITNRPEFETMFGGFLTRFTELNILVDCGTVTGAADMVARLKAVLGESPLDLVLLTHAHLDHSGGLGAILETWPKAKAVTHAQAMDHLVDPTRLWRSTQKVMGELAAMYGEPRPVDPDRLIPHHQFQSPGIKILETPGHAAHHLSYRLGDIIFAGEAVGCPHYWGGRLLSRPATPPRYFPEPTFASLDRLENEPVEEAYFGHTHEKGPLKAAIKAYRRQLSLWDELLRLGWSTADPTTSLEELTNTLTDNLFHHDPDLRPLLAWPETSLAIEKIFARNSVAGFLGHYAQSLKKRN